MSLEFPIQQDIFNISTESEFNEAAIDIFRYQYANNKVYNQYVNLLEAGGWRLEAGISNFQVPASNFHYKDIPFLPIEFYKSHKIVSSIKYQVSRESITFISSGTTGSEKSKHHVADINIYKQSISKCFEHFYGDIKNYCFLGLLPSYEEIKDSSLSYMVNHFIEKSKYKESGFYLNRYNELAEILKKLSDKSIKTIMIGLSYALLDFAEFLVSSSKNKKQGTKNMELIVMETGGMKGRRKELVKEELHSILCESLGVKFIHSEYGMTELLSQAYSNGKGIYEFPKWMKVFTRDINDPLRIMNYELEIRNETGGINIIDLANIYSCSFIMTNDLGRIHPNNSFEIMGRFDNSDLRGCNMMI